MFSFCLRYCYRSCVLVDDLFGVSFFSLEHSRYTCLADYYGSLNSGMKDITRGEQTIVLSGSRPCLTHGGFNRRVTCFSSVRDVVVVDSVCKQIDAHIRERSRIEFGF